MPKTETFWNRIAARYAKSPVADPAVYAQKLAETQARLRPDMQVLEVGCGTGSTALAHAPCVAHIRATDVSGKMLAFAEAKAKDAGIHNITFERASLEDLTLAPASVDAALALNLLHLLPDRDAALAKLAAALKPGGLLVTSTQCLAETSGWLRWVAPPGQALGLLPHLAFFTRAALEHSHAAAGLTLEHAWLPTPKASVFLVARKAA